MFFYDRVNMHVKVFGSLREYEGKRHVLIYKIAPLTDFNELTHHMLETVLLHLQNTRGPIPGSAAAAIATPCTYRLILFIRLIFTKYFCHMVKMIMERNVIYLYIYIYL